MPAPEAAAPCYRSGTHTLARRRLAFCEEYGAEPTNFVIFVAEWLEVRAKAEKTLGSEGPNEDRQARNYDAMYYGKKGYE